jgi:PAS domain S-box-containing protein
MSQPSREFHPEYEALRREYHDFRYHLPDALIEVDLDSLQVLSLNRQAEILFGFSPRDVEAGLNGSALMAPEEFPRAIAILAQYVAESRAGGAPYVRGGRQNIYQQMLRRKDGSTFLGETQTSFVLDARGVPVRMFSIIREVPARQ